MKEECSRPTAGKAASGCCAVAGELPNLSTLLFKARMANKHIDSVNVRCRMCNKIVKMDQYGRIPKFCTTHMIYVRSQIWHESREAQMETLYEVY